MSEEQPKSRRRWRWLAVIVVLLLAGAVAVRVVVSTAAFHRYVQSRLVAAIQTATGGRAEIGSLTWNLSGLEFTLNNLTIHGLEGPGETPYAHVDRMFVAAKVISMFTGQIGLRTLTLEHPVVHIIVYPDGRTNQPSPRQETLGRSPIEQLFRLEVNRAEVRDGVLLVNDHPLPLDFSATEVRAGLDYAVHPAHYTGTVEMGTIETKYGAWRPFASSASAAVDLYSDRAELRTFSWKSGESVVQVSGILTGFARPAMTFNYSGHFDVAQFAPTMRLPEARRGVVEVTGSGSYSGTDYKANGKMQVRDFAWSQPELRVAGVNAGAEYQVDKTNAIFTHIFGSALGGAVTGDATVRDWTSDLQKGSLKLEVHGLSLRSLAVAMATPALPLDRMRPAGSASGTVAADWKGSPSRAIADIRVALAPPAQVAPGEFPVSGQVTAAFSPSTGVALVRSAEIQGRTLHLSGSGAIGWRGAQLNFTANATDITDANPLLELLHIHLPLPPDTTAAHASMVGALSGNMKSPVVSGHVEASEVQATLPGRTSPRRVRFDGLAMDLRYSPSGIVLSRGALRRGAEQANFDFSSQLVNGSMTDSGMISAHLSATSFAVDDLLGLAGYTWPITGALTASLQVGGTKAALNGSGAMRIVNGTAWGEPVRSASANLALANHEVRASDVVIAHNGARIIGDAAYNLASTGFHFRVQGTDFQLANFQRLQSAHVHTSGLMTFNAEGAGTREQPSVNGNLQIRNWVVNGEAVGDLNVKATTAGDVMHVTGATGFRTADLTLDGTVRLHDEFPTALTLHFTRLDFDPLLTAFTRAHLTGHSSMDGSLTLAGPLKSPDLLTVSGNIPKVSANLENVHVENDGPVRFTIANETLRLEQLNLTGTDTTFSASGTVGLARGAPVDIKADGNINLQLLQSFNSDLHSAGRAAFQLQLRGSLERPALLGQVTLTNGDIALINFPNGLSSINGTLIFNQDRIQVQKLTAQTGGGNVTIGGFVSYGATLGFNLTMNGKGVRVRYPAGVSTTVNPDLQLTGTSGNLLLSGQLVVERFSTGADFDLATMLARVRLSSEMPNPRSPLSTLHFDVHIASTPELQLQLSAAKMSGNVDVRLRGTADHPILLGRLDITEGQITFNGTNYNIERGDVTFTNPVRIEPVLDVEVTTRVRDYDIALGFHGPVDRLSTTYRSDPPLPTTDIIALLAFGTTRSESEMYTGANPTFTETASNAILGQALAQSSNNRVQRLFGVSRIKISPQVESPTVDTNPNAQLTIEQQVSKNITVTYITDLSRSQQQVIQFEYAINRNFSVIALRDQNGVLSFDFRYRQRKR